MIGDKNLLLGWEAQHPHEVSLGTTKKVPGTFVSGFKVCLGASATCPLPIREQDAATHPYCQDFILQGIAAFSLAEQTWCDLPPCSHKDLVNC